MKIAETVNVACLFLLPLGFWAVGCWLLAVGCWVLGLRCRCISPKNVKSQVLNSHLTKQLPGGVWAWREVGEGAAEHCQLAGTLQLTVFIKMLSKTQQYPPAPTLRGPNRKCARTKNEEGEETAQQMAVKELGRDLGGISAT